MTTWLIARLAQRNDLRTRFIIPDIHDKDTRREATYWPFTHNEPNPPHPAVLLSVRIYTTAPQE